MPDRPVDQPAEVRIILGRITAPFGIRGWVKVESFTDPPEALMDQDTWRIAPAGGGTRAPRSVTLVDARPHGRHFCAQLEGVDDRDAAEALAGSEISVERAQLPPTAPAEYYQADLIGLAVKSHEGIDFGMLSHFVDVPSGSMMVVRGAQRERWVPAFAPYLRKVDLAAGEILVEWPADL